jgi:hypothetical protein
MLIKLLREVVQHNEWDVNYLTNLVQALLLLLSLQALQLLVPSSLLPLGQLLGCLLHLLVPLDESLGLHDVLDLAGRIFQLGLD